MFEEYSETAMLRHLLEVQEQVLYQQRTQLESQQQQIADQRVFIGQQRLVMEALERQVRTARLETVRARADETAALAALQQGVKRIPCWLRVLLRLEA